MLQFLVDTLLRASDLALIALGLSMVYGLVKFPNIAHVQYAMFGAYVTYAMHASGVPLVLAIAISCAVTGALTLGLHLLVFRRLLRAGPAIAMIGSLAVAMLVVAFMQGFAGSFPRMFNLPLTEPILIGEARVTATQLYFVGTTVVLLLLFAMLLFFTRTGRAMRALASNPALAAASGLNAEGITRGVAFASGAIAGLGGGMLALSTGAHINLGYDLLLPVFAAAILGGLGNPWSRGRRTADCRDGNRGDEYRFWRPGGRGSAVHAGGLHQRSLVPDSAAGAAVQALWPVRPGGASCLIF
jgi:branched-chain amino acid transport system permease protein